MRNFILITALFKKALFMTSIVFMTVIFMTAMFITLPSAYTAESHSLVIKGTISPPAGLEFEVEQLRIWLADASTTHDSEVELHDDHSFTAQFHSAPAGKYTLYFGVFALEENAQLAKALQHGFIVSTESVSVDLGNIKMVKKNFLPNGSTAPPFELESISGKSIDLKEYKGKVVMLDFWASWCGHCKVMKPEIVELYNKYHDEYGFEIIGMSLDRDVNDLKQYVKTNKIPWQQCFLGSFDHKMIKDYSVIAIPDAILISPDGNILKKGLKGEHGIQNNLEEILKRYKK